MESPILLGYSIRNAEPFKDLYRNGETIYYVHIRDLDLSKVRVRVKPFTPPPPLTFTTADAERQHVADKYLQGF